MTAKWIDVKRGSWSGSRYWHKQGGTHPGIDAYLVWGDSTSFVDLSRRDREYEEIPLLMELRVPASEFAAKRLGKWGIHVPAMYRATSRGLGATRFCTASVTRRFFESLDDPKLQELVARFELGLPTDRPPRETKLEDTGPTIDGKYWENLPVVVGTIDDNFAFAHERFRRSRLHTRVENFWTQDGTDPVPGSGYGKEYTKREIDRLLAACANDGHVDEDRVYREAGYDDASHRYAHGTHVMDLASGEDPDDVDPATTPRIVCVQFPRRDNWGAMPLGVQVLDAMRYILDRADRLARARTKRAAAVAPVVINLAHANLAGPHDGSSILESAMDDLIASRRKAMDFEVILPAGNNHLSRCRARFDLAGGRSRELLWRIHPDDATPNFLEIWLPDDVDEKSIEIDVEPPGLPSARVRQGDVMALKSGDDSLCTAVFLDHAGNGKGKLALVAVAPTSTHRREQGGAVAPFGIWKVTVTKTTPGRADVNAWIQRDDPVLGTLPYGRQSFFEDKLYKRFEDYSGRPKETEDEKSVVRREGTINGIATGRQTIVIGGFRRSDGSTAPYSGSARKGSGLAPDAMTVSDDSAISRGVLAAGVRSGSTVAMSGTSVAVGQVARHVAKVMVKAVIDAAHGMQAARKPVAAKKPVANAMGEFPKSKSLGRQAVHSLGEQINGHPEWPRSRPPRERSLAGRDELPPIVTRNSSRD